MKIKVRPAHYFPRYSGLGDFGARRWKTINTVLSKAVDACNQNGGGTVVVPPVILWQNHPSLSNVVASEPGAI
jgi:hypothetical protein